MKRKITCLLLALTLTIIVIAGCSSEKIPPPDVPKILNELNVEYSDQEVMFQILGATDGSKYMLSDGGAIEYYTFDTSSEAFKTLKKDGGFSWAPADTETIIGDGWAVNLIDVKDDAIHKAISGK